MLVSILLLTLIAALSSTAGLLDRIWRRNKGIGLKVQMPGNLPILTLMNNGMQLNFLLDTGSNISHIEPDTFGKLKTGECYTDESNVTGLGSSTTGTAFSCVEFEDKLNNKYEVVMHISETLRPMIESVYAHTGVKLHGLLGTDFINRYGYVMDFKKLKVYPNKEKKDGE